MDEKRFSLPKIDPSSTARPRPSRGEAGESRRGRERPRNPLTVQGIKALVIVLAVILFISAVVYLNITRQKKEVSPVLPATTTQEEVTTEPEPTEIPTVVPTEEPTPIPEETPASPAGEPTATESAPTE